MRAFFAACFAIAAACSPDDPGPRPSGDPAVCQVTQAALVAATFNAALAPGLEHDASARLPLVAAAISGVDVDLLCLQEVWTDEAVQAVTQALGLPARNVLAADTGGEGETGLDWCTGRQIDGVMACARANCAGVADEEASICAAERCRSEAFDVYVSAPRCFDCLLATAGRSLDGIAAACGAAPGVSRLYGGNNGVLLASRHPLKDPEAVPLPSSGANRVALFATIEGVGPEPIEVACTHLSSSNILPPTDKRFATWNEEMIAQVGIVSARLAARAGGRPWLLLGDLNAGPSSEDGLDASEPAVWNAIEDEGFSSPAARADPPVCSRCAGNTFSPTDSHRLIDHVLTRDGSARWSASCAQTVIDQPAAYVNAAGAPVTTHLSDHYGTLVKLDLE